MTRDHVELDDLLVDFPGRAAVYARRLGDGFEVDVDGGRPFSTGSAAKVLVLLAYCEQVAQGILDPATRIVLKDESFNRLGSGVLRFCRPGLAPALDDFAFLMMIVSDNVATDVLLDVVGGRPAVNTVVRRLGIDGAEITSDSVWVMPPARFGTATPRALAGAYEVIADPIARVYPTSAAEDAKRIMQRHQHLEGFARHLSFSPHAVDFDFRSPVRIWSKAGSYPTVQCEAGLFETDNARWVLAVMCDELTELKANSTSAALTLIARTAERVHDLWG